MIVPATSSATPSNNCEVTLLDIWKNEDRFSSIPRVNVESINDVLAIVVDKSSIIPKLNNELDVDCEWLEHDRCSIEPRTKFVNVFDCEWHETVNSIIPPKVNSALDVV